MEKANHEIDTGILLLETKVLIILKANRRRMCKIFFENRKIHSGENFASKLRLI